MCSVNVLLLFPVLLLFTTPVLRDCAHCVMYALLTVKSLLLSPLVAVNTCAVLRVVCFGSFYLTGSIDLIFPVIERTMCDKHLSSQDDLNNNECGKRRVYQCARDWKSHHVAEFCAVIFLLQHVEPCLFSFVPAYIIHIC